MDATRVLARDELPPLPGHEASAGLLESLIRALAATRAERHPPVPTIGPQAQPRTGSLHAIDNPAWEIHADATGALTLSLRHPGFGWLSFVLPPTSSALLRQCPDRHCTHTASWAGTL